MGEGEGPPKQAAVCGRWRDAREGGGGWPPGVGARSAEM